MSKSLRIISLAFLYHIRYSVVKEQVKIFFKLNNKYDILSVALLYRLGKEVKAHGRHLQQFCLTTPGRSYPSSSSEMAR